jgi:hypothetical protein
MRVCLNFKNNKMINSTQPYSQLLSSSSKGTIIYYNQYIITNSNIYKNIIISEKQQSLNIHLIHNPDLDVFDILYKYKNPILVFGSNPYIHITRKLKNYIHTSDINQVMDVMINYDNLVKIILIFRSSIGIICKSLKQYFKIIPHNYVNMYNNNNNNEIVNIPITTNTTNTNIITTTHTISDKVDIVDKPESPKVITEDLGKIFEMSICLLYEIEYDGSYKYSIPEATIIKNKLNKLRDIFPHKLKHIAKNGNKYDFESVDDVNIHLSAKTTKKDGKVCPQVIGQPSKKKFCEFFEIDINYSLDQIKEYIINNVIRLLDIYTLNTFDCPIIYYNQNTNLLLFVKLKEPINWNNYEIKFSHNVKNKQWNESSSIIINDTCTIGEFQIHNHRNCIKFRWIFEKVLNIFKDNFEIVSL